jgi:hypothetical protein
MVKNPLSSPEPPFKRIRSQLGMTQSNVWMYENRGQAIPPEVAKKLIAYAKSLKHKLTYNNIYES